MHYVVPKSVYFKVSFWLAVLFPLVRTEGLLTTTKNRTSTTVLSHDIKV